MPSKKSLEAISRDRKYRAGYVNSRAELAIAAQVYELRKQFGLSQHRLAEMINVTKDDVRHMEDPDQCAKIPVMIFLRMAKALDIAFVGKFVTHGVFLDILGEEKIAPQALRVEPFAA